MTIITFKKDRDLVFISPWFLKIGVPAALAVILAVSISVSLSVSLLVFGGLRGRARGQDVIADIIKDAEQTERYRVWRWILRRSASVLQRCQLTWDQLQGLSSHPVYLEKQFFSISRSQVFIARSCFVKVTFVLLLELLVSSSLTEVRQDLSELRDHNVVRCQSRLGLKDRIQQTVRVTDQLAVQHRVQTGRYLHAGAVGFTADQSGRDVCVSELVIQVDHIGHPARQEELVPLYLTWAEHHTVDVPTCGGGHTRTQSAEIFPFM